MNPAAWVERHARQRPDDPALADGDRVYAPLGVHGAQDPVVVRLKPCPRLVIREPHRSRSVAMDMGSVSYPFAAWWRSGLCGVMIVVEGWCRRGCSSVWVTDFDSPLRGTQAPRH